MIEIIKKIIDLIIIAINVFFYLKIELTEEVSIYLGLLIIAFLFIVLTIYLIFKSLSIID